jgi:hypothetical protein
VKKHNEIPQNQKNINYPTIMPAKINVFIAYAPEDELLKEQLERHLSVLKRNQLIDVWHDRRIEAGADWSQRISQYLDSSQLILLLISPDFLASDYLYQTELKAALKKHFARRATVIPVLLRPCVWQMQELEMLNALPDNQEAVTSKAWESTDAAFEHVTEHIKKELMHYLPLRNNDNATALSASNNAYSPMKIAMGVVGILTTLFIAYQIYTNFVSPSNTTAQNAVNNQVTDNPVSTNNPKATQKALTLNITAAQPITFAPGDFQYERVYSVSKATVENIGGNSNLVSITVGLNFKGILNDLLTNDDFRLIAPELKGPMAPVNTLIELVDPKSYKEGEIKFELDSAIKKFTIQVEGKKNWDFSIE